MFWIAAQRFRTHYNCVHNFSGTKKKLTQMCQLFLLYIQVAAEHFQCVVNTVDVAAFVAVAGVDAGADEAVADVETGI